MKNALALQRELTLYGQGLLLKDSINFYYTLLIFLRNEPHSAAEGRRQPFHLDID
jgi:hypothetical protein